MSQDNLPPAVPLKYLPDAYVAKELTGYSKLLPSALAAKEIQEESEITAFSAEETQELFLKKIKGIKEYWRDLPGKTLEERMFGFAFTILSTIDGSAIDVPGFRLMPNPHESDAEYLKKNKERWFDSEVDIGGTLHDNWCRIHR